VVAHVNAKITRNAVEQAVRESKPLKFLLDRRSTSESATSQAAQGRDRSIPRTAFVDSEVVRIRRRSCFQAGSPSSMAQPSLVANCGAVLQGRHRRSAASLSFAKLGIASCRFELHQAFHHGNLPDLARAGEKNFLHGGGLVVGDVGAQCR